MDGKSKSPIEEKIEQLKDILPEAFTEGKIDWEKLKATLGENINFKNERYVLNWAGKSDAFRALQSPSTKTLIPAKDESIDFDKTEHIFIEGENLEVLKILQKSYFGKVKMIYIDPPYNTGNDSFIYPDKFSETKEEYQKRIGDKDEDGYMTKEGLFHKNSKENGQYHSNWLSMMYPRLFLAKNLLREDGVIFVSIDDNEVHNLRMIMNEIFGEENFISTISRATKKGGSNGDFFSPSVDYILIYAKSKDKVGNFKTPLTEEYLSKYKLNDENGLYIEKGLYQASLTLDRSRNARYFIECPDKTKCIPIENKRWRVIEESYLKLLENNEIVFKEVANSPLLDEKGNQSKWNVYTKQYLHRIEEKGFVPSNFVDNYINSLSTSELKSMDIPFDFAKPVDLIRFLIQIINTQEGIILDFFCGSGTTAHSVYSLNQKDKGNRKYIMVQLPEPCDESSEAFKAGYKTIADIGKERIRRVSAKIKEENPDYQGDLGFKVFKLSDSNFKQWKQLDKMSPQALETQMDMFVDPVSENAETQYMVYELLLKAGKNLNSNVEELSGYFRINDNELILMLTDVSDDIIKAILQEKPRKVIALDRLFKGNDQLKTNTVLQFKDAGIEFKTI